MKAGGWERLHPPAGWQQLIEDAKQGVLRAPGVEDEWAKTALRIRQADRHHSKGCGDWCAVAQLWKRLGSFGRCRHQRTLEPPA